MEPESRPQSAVQWVYQNSKHTGNVYHVLVTIAIAYGEKGACLSMKDIADRTKVSQATARRAVESLAKDGTITVIKNGGEQRKSGATNCYHIPGFDTPITIVTPLAPDDTPITQEIPLSSGDTSIKSEPYAGVSAGSDAATRETDMSLKEFKEFEKEIKESEAISQNNSLKSIDTSAQDDAPVVNDGFEDTLKDKPADIQAAYQTAFVKANPPEGKQQNAPNPGSAAPLPPDVEKDYLDHWGKTAVTAKERVVLFELIKAHGVERLRAIIADADTVDPDGKAIKNPAAWIRDTGGKVSKPPRYAGQVTANAQNYDEIFNRDPEPEADFKPVADVTVDEHWTRLADVTRGRMGDVYGRFFRHCAFGGVDNGVLNITVPDQKTLSGCQSQLNYHGALFRDAEVIWQDLKAVRFELEEAINVPAPEQP